MSSRCTCRCSASTTPSSDARARARLAPPRHGERSLTTQQADRALAALSGRLGRFGTVTVPRSQRLRMGALRPGDILFFGSAAFTARATESNVDHAGIYLGNNWVINSSGQGVYVLPLAGSWLGDSFAWGRRIVP